MHTDYFHPTNLLPRYEALTPDRLNAVVPAIQAQIDEVRRTAEEVARTHHPTWDGVVAVLAEKNETLSQLWGLIAHLHSTCDSPSVRDIYNQLLPEVTALSSWLGQHSGLYRQWRALADSREFSSLGATRVHAINQGLRDFRLAGAALSDEQRARFMDIEQELAALSAKFSENVLDATNAFSYRSEREEEVAGLPQEVLANAEARAQKNGARGWHLTLQAPDYLAVMEYARNRALREHFYRHYTTRASELTPEGLPGVQSQWDNTPLMEQILRLRAEKAALLGFDDYGALSLATKMAKESARVESFLLDLATCAQPFAKRDMAALRQFAKKNGLAEMQVWDIPYLSRLLRESIYDYTDEEVKPYFPAPTVMAGLFSLCTQLFGVRFVEEPTSVWHEGVQFFRLIDSQGQRRGGFYADLYARDSKKSGAWMDEVQSRGHYRQTFHHPVAYLICNFTPPLSGKPSLLTMDEVTTLLHEMGHVLNHILSEIDDLPITGIRGVEWDAVELPSQFMENFAWHADILRALSGHVDSGEPLPVALFDKMNRAKNFQSGMATLRQIEFALFDWRIHQQGFNPRQMLPELSRIRQEVAVVQPPVFNRFPHSFSHIFAGGYSAGYYSYKWAEVLSCDGFGLFEEALGQRDTINALQWVGEQFRREVLSVGGSRPANESFIAYRGREPNLAALLRMSGLVEE